MTPRIATCFLFVLLQTAALTAQRTIFCEVKFKSETKRLGGFLGKTSDPFPVFAKGLGFEAGATTPFAAGQLALKGGVIEFFRHSLSTAAGTWRYQELVFPAEVQYHTPPFLRTTFMHFGLRAGGGLCFVSSLIQSPAASVAEKSRQTLGEWNIALCGYLNLKKVRRRGAAFYTVGLDRIGKYNFYDIELFFPFNL